MQVFLKDNNNDSDSNNNKNDNDNNNGRTSNAWNSELTHCYSSLDEILQYFPHQAIREV